MLTNWKCKYDIMTYACDGMVHCMCKSIVNY